MTSLASIIERISDLTSVLESRGDGLFAAVCSIAAPSAPSEVAEAWPGQTLPIELQEWWRLVGEARLFEDPDYGQWGLVLFSATASRTRTDAEFHSRPADMVEGDVVVGGFLGDQELVVFSEEQGVLIALPLDDRSDWFKAAPSLVEFLERYAAARGAKFWEGC